MTQSTMMFLLLASAVAAAAQTRADRKSVEAVVLGFNQATRVNDTARLLSLFTKDGRYAENKSAPIPIANALQSLAAKRLPWDERTPLTIKVRNTRFLNPTTVEVDAIQSDYAPMLRIARKWACVFIMVQNGQQWKIKSYREVFSQLDGVGPAENSHF